MAIIVMLDNAAADFPEGAYCDLGWSRGNDHLTPERGAVVLLSTYQGLCVKERERNMRDDSDFFMTVWDPIEKFAHEIEFASTRGWSYPCLASSVDATPEVMAEYRAWSDEKARRAKIQAKWSKRRADTKLAIELGLQGRADLRRLRSALGNADAFEAVCKLLRTRKFRSEFRAKLCQQVRSWLADPAPKYATPLSTKQLQYV